jgi:hypothetical protein
VNEYEKITGCVLSFDPAQLADYSALAVIDRVETWREPPFEDAKPVNTRHRVLKLERMPQGITYPNQIRHVLRTWQILDAKYRKIARPGILIDVGGVGLSVYDSLREAARDLNLRAPIYGMRFTAGFYPSVHDGKNIRNIPKTEVFAALTVAMQSGLIEINPSLKFAPILREEAMNFNVSFSEHGRQTMEAAPGFHDDLLCAVAQGIYHLAGKKQTPVVLPRMPFQ